MRQELWNSLEAVASFGAEMEGLPEVLEGLAKIVDTLCEQGQPVEIIRKESLSALAVRAASRMLQMAYSAIVAIEPLRLPALPLPVAHGKGPAFYGAPAPMLTPWLTLAVLAELQTGPVSIAFTHGQRVTALPPAVSPQCWNGDIHHKMSCALPMQLCWIAMLLLCSASR
jgi:FAM91 C-terminus